MTPDQNRLNLRCGAKWPLRRHDEILLRFHTWAGTQPPVVSLYQVLGLGWAFSPEAYLSQWNPHTARLFSRSPTNCETKSSFGVRSGAWFPRRAIQSSFGRENPGVDSVIDRPMGRSNEYSPRAPQLQEWTSRVQGRGVFDDLISKVEAEMRLTSIDLGMKRQMPRTMV